MPENTIITKIGAYDNPGVEKSLSSNVAISAENIKATGVHGLIEGTGITLVKDPENGTVTINGSEGIIYSAGPNINITNDIISGKDWSSDISEAVEPKLDTTAFSTVSGTFLTAHQQISADEWNGTYDTVLNYSAKWSTESNWTEVIEDASANAYNSAINWVEKQGYLTAHQSLDEYATINYVDSGLDLKQDKGNYYSASNPSGFITRVDLSNYYTKDETSGANQLNTKFETVDENIFNLYEITNTLSSTKQDNLIPTDNIYISGNNEIGISGKLPFNVDDSMYAVETSAGVYIGLNEYTTNEYFAGTFGTDFTNNDFILSGDLFSANENIKYMNLSINYKVDNGAGNPDFVYKNELKISGAEINENYVHYIPGYISTDSYSVFLNVQNNSPFKFTLSSESTQHTGDEIKINVLGIKYHYPDEYEEIVDENDVDKLMVFNKTITTIDAGDDSILVDDDDSTIDIGY